MANRRSHIILVSLFLHASVGIGAYVAGIWDLERLDTDVRATSTLATLAPAPAPAGGGLELPKAKIEHKKLPEKKRIVHDTVQPTPIPVTDPSPQTTADTTGGDGGGDGTGTGTGTGPGSGDSTGDCTVDCGDGPDTDVTPPPPAKPTIVAPDVLGMMRISGSTQIRPTTPTKNQMIHDGKSRVIGVARVCVSQTGSITAVTMLKSTGYGAYDRELVGGIRTWTYRPYQTGGRAIEVCGTVTFVYSIR